MNISAATKLPTKQLHKVAFESGGHDGPNPKKKLVTSY